MYPRVALHTLKDRLVMYVHYYTMSDHVCVMMHFDPILTYYFFLYFLLRSAHLDKVCSES